MKTCSRCRVEKSVDEFNFKDKEKGRLQPYCRECNSNYLKEHYKNNVKYYVDKAKRNDDLARGRIREYILAYLNLHPCIDCGETDIVVLDFDHVYGSKEHTISCMICSVHNTESIIREIEKCVVRCANCHRRKTSNEQGWWKSKLSEVV